MISGLSRVSPRAAADGVEQGFAVGVLEQVAARASLQAAQHQVILVVGSQDDNGNLRLAEAQLFDGIRIISALLTLREKVIRPLLAGARYGKLPSLPSRSTPSGDLYQTLLADMQLLFQSLGLGVQAA